ncbi:MAG: hypothetical protein JXB00_01030 [Bacteroidales bacterium]|nr:hypothetical protein [Bacteroidales bacterium]
MKKYYLILIALCICSINFIHSQQKVALQSNGSTTIFGGSDPFTAAYNASVNGDTLYLPGGTIPYPAIISKGLVIIGAGHYPDSAIATGKTVLPGNLSISEDADNLWLEGIEFTGNISFTSNHKVDSVVIRRCKFNNINYNGTGATPCLNNNIIENVIIGEAVFTNATSGLFSNNIINGQIAYANFMGISNNILLFNPGSTGNAATVTFNNVDNCFISNNIIFRSNAGWVCYGADLNTFANNIFTVVPSTGTNTWVNNYYSVVLTSIFISQTGNVFDYAHNYHLQSPSTYEGTDSAEVGIYDGLFPCKEGAVPQNPHIQIKNIAPATDANGDLPIQIQVGAQNK